MMLVCVDILKLLSDHGWSTYRLIRERRLSNGTISRFRAERMISLKTLAIVCELCQCQPGDILSYVPITKNDE